MSGEESSSYSSIAKEYGGAVIGAARFEVLKATLARAAAERTVLDGGVKNKDLVVSAHIKHMLVSYRGAATGGVVVVCSPPDSGKTHAAEFLMHGDHPFRPDRSLKVTAVSMKDFPSEYASECLGVEKAAPTMSRILCDALSSTEVARGPAAAASNLAAKGRSLADEVLCMSPRQSVSLDENALISVYGQEKVCRNPESPPSPAFRRLPLLVIDNFDEQTDENEAFALKLLHDASDTDVFVFILTKNKDFATSLVALNGGQKIKPLFGNVDNSNYGRTDPFEGLPEWNDMPWSAEALRDLIRPQCEKYKIRPEELVPDGASMKPRQALNLVVDRVEFGDE